MHTRTFYLVFRAVGYVVLLLGIIAILYALYISLSNWHGIGV